MSISPTLFDPGLYRGPAPRTAEDLAILQALGIETVINLEQKPTMIAGAATIGIRTLWFPLRQVFAPIHFRVAAAINAMLGAAHGDRKVYVCCHEGKDRTGFLVAMYRVYFQGWSKATARKEMRAMGNHWWLAFWRWFI